MERGDSNDSGRTGIESWLDRIGLRDYAAAFEENHVTPETLVELTTEDLKEIGVASLGHRKRLLAEIAALGAARPQTPADTASAEMTAPTLPSSVGGKPELPAKVTRPPAPTQSIVAVDLATRPRPSDRKDDAAKFSPQRSVASTPKGAATTSIQAHAPAPSTSPASPIRKRAGFLATLFASKFLFISIVAHLVFGLGATYFIVQRIQAKRKVTFQGGPPSTNPSKRALEHKVSMAQKKKTGGAPPQAKRIVSAGIAKVSLPDLPTIPTASTVVPGMMAGMGGVGTGLGMGFGSGMGSGMGGGGGGGGAMSFFGFRGAGAGLVGTFFDLKQKKNKQPSGVNARNYTGIVKKWVDEGLRESVIDDYFKAPNKLSATQFMIPDMPADEAPKAYGVEKEVQPAQWVAHYRGRVSPPKSGTYRFVGAADDVLIVRFAGKLVLDGSWESTSKLKHQTVYHNGYGGHPDQGFPRGEEFRAEAGQWYDIDVVIGERPGGHFWTCLCIEEQGVTYKKDTKGMPLFPLFRFTAGKLPDAGKSKLPPFDPNGPIWKAQAAGGGSLLDALKRP